MPPTAEGPTLGLRERKKARTRAAIQTHALRLFRAQGYQATTVEQIITAAEVSETTFFRYFPTKEDVVLQDDFDPVIVKTLLRQPAESSPVEAVRRALRAHFDTLTPEQSDEMRERLRLVIAEPALRAAMLDQMTQTMRLIAEAFAERTGREHTDLAVRATAGAVMGALIAALDAWADDPDNDLPTIVDAALGHLEHGLTR
ncbi:TetR family transcriptional regulator [Cryptosporangium aurantiacum]|uniref:Transcriptional regulator, TetR family n=1 Tax=Cryptosporangium aurantiacum TaxID=134849 RepID=A0A1M7RMT7_9ACTN|nr:TetR family transcriptional regulator [Cryptosporangium aurantiacum]SHN47511.1 transcriptional regulator, TetR family [Cryptosporangium aurantiacum]